MSIVDENPGPTNWSERQRVTKLIIGRMMVAAILFAVAYFWYGSRLDVALSELPNGILIVLSLSLGLSVIYLVLTRVASNLKWQLWVQFVLDAVLITWLVWRTGDLASPYITLYIILISVASLFFRPFPTIIVAIICILMFASMAFLSGMGIISGVNSGQPLSKVTEIASFHVVALLVVGLLAARLAERRSSGERLAETAKTLANLQLLHERIIESIRSGLITTDLDGRIYTFNAAATEITGYRPAEMKGRSVFSLFGDIRESIDLSLHFQGEGEQIPRFETDLETPQGFAVRIGYSISQLYSESHEASGMIITFQDLTEIRSMEESVRRKDRLAAVGRVGAGLAHEIRNPLGAMRGAIQVLRSNMPPESIHVDLMDIILRESDRLNNIITNFLSYARPKAGNFTEIDLCEAIRDTVRLLEHSPDIKKSHTIVANLPDTPVTTLGDVTQLKQIFWNLSRNSLSAMPDGGSLHVGVGTLPNKRVKVTFEDTGVGMPPEQVEQLFEPFANSTTGGTGLGLSIVYQIVRDHSGVINVRSSEGEGTLIAIEFPREAKVKPAEKAADDRSNGMRLKEYLNVKEGDS
ncbi:MAG: PAS domain S-box protein [Blastocatellia bacterium]|nr:PAS domain S-box protein [Blastocatellia bacterium]